MIRNYGLLFIIGICFILVGLFCPKAKGQTKEARKIIEKPEFDRVAKRDSNKVIVEHLESFGDDSTIFQVDVFSKKVDSSLLRTVFNPKDLLPALDTLPPPPPDLTNCRLKNIWSTPQSKIKVLILGDGYILDDSTKFWSDAAVIFNSLSSEPVHAPYKNYFKYDAFYCPSLERGINNPTAACSTGGQTIPVQVVHNRYNTTANYGGTCRLFYSINKTQIAADAMAAGTYNYVIIIVNTPYYGGSGGPYPCASTHASSGEIMNHEFNHNFTAAKDEYAGLSCPSSDGHNVANSSAAAIVKFGQYKLFLNPSKGANYSNDCWWKFGPYYKNGFLVQACKMDRLGFPFCPEDSAAIVNKIKALAGIVTPTDPPVQPPVVTDTCKFTATASWSYPYCTLTINTTRPYSTFKFSQRVQKVPAQYLNGEMLYSNWVVSGVEFLSQTSSTLTVRVKMRWCWTSTPTKECYKQQVLIHKDKCDAYDLKFTSP